MAAPKATSPNQTYILIGLLLAIAGFWGSYQFLVPALKEKKVAYEAAKADDEALQTDLTNLMTAQQELTTAKNQVTQSGTDISPAYLLSVIPTFEDVPALYLQMEDMVRRGAAGGVTVTYQVSNPVAEPQGLGVKVPLTIIANGPYASLKQFLATVERNIRPISLTDVAFAPYIQTSTSGAAVTQQTTGHYTLSASGYARAQKLSPSYADEKTSR